MSRPIQFICVPLLYRMPLLRAVHVHRITIRQVIPVHIAQARIIHAPNGRNIEPIWVMTNGGSPYLNKRPGFMAPIVVI
jgi:hypothetical protein